MKSLKILSLFFVFVLTITTTNFAQTKETSFPSPTGFVNDLASIISPETKNNLKTKLRDYRDKTSIEIAAVIVKSLDGRSVEEYTNALFRKWGVGNKKKNNGVVFLVALKERQMRIETGYGVELDLTDAQAGEILRSKVKPFFKNNQLELGIVAGVNSIIKTLGQTPFEARAEERRLAEEKRKREEEIIKRKIKNILMLVGMVGVIILISVSVFVAYFFIEKRIAENDRLKIMHNNNADRIKMCRALAEKIQKSLPVAEKRLETLKEKIPEKQFESLKELLVKAKRNLPSQKKDLVTMTLDHINWGWKKADIVSVGVEKVLKALKEENKFSEAVDNKIVELREAEKKSQKLFAELPKLIKSSEDELKHPDVSKETNDLLENAKADFEKAKILVRDIKSSWLTIFASLSAVLALINTSGEKAKKDKEGAEEARKPKPAPVIPIPTVTSRQQDSDDDDRSKPSWSDSSSDSSSDGSSDFGGFSGGGSGGGGASDSW